MVSAPQPGSITLSPKFGKNIYVKNQFWLNSEKVKC